MNIASASRGLIRGILALLSGWLLLAVSPAHAQSGQGIGVTLEGCRNDGSIQLPLAGAYVCPNAAYTTGNLGKGWNELDLVPHRLTLAAANSAPATQTYTIAYAVDSLRAAVPGYDLLSMPTLNAARSTGTCTIGVVAPSGGSGASGTGVLGGSDVALYRRITITQTRGAVCVIDFYARLGIGSSQYPGSSLQAAALNENLDSAGIGERRVSIPVKEIEPQGLRKTMSASAESSYRWTLDKTGSTSKLDFGDLCAAGAPTSKSISFRVEWKRVAATAGNVTVETRIYARNPAARTIKVRVTDRIYRGLDQTNLLDTKTGDYVSVASGEEKLVLSHVVSLSTADAGTVGDSLNDVAEGSYLDEATGIEIPTVTRATASTVIQQGAQIDDKATVTDLETLVGSGLSFSVSQNPSAGSFLNGYVSGSKATSVSWRSNELTGDGFVDFSKLVYVDGLRVLTGSLVDTATLVTSTGYTVGAGPLDIGISASPLVKINIRKTLPFVPSATGAKLRVTFTVEGQPGVSAYKKDHVIEFAAGESDKTITVDNLAPDLYTVTEGTITYSDAATPEKTISLVPTSGSQTADFQPVNGVVPACSKQLDFINEVPTGAWPRAQVKKLVVTASGDTALDNPWSFTLTGPAGFTAVTATDNAGDDVASGFGVDLKLSGTYTVTETLKADPWLLTGVTPSTDNKVCSFTVALPADLGKTFSCTFTNTKKGKVRVVKTLDGGALTNTSSFTFQLRTGASATANGTVLETLAATLANGGQLNFSTWLVPGSSYQLCEQVLAGWSSTLGSFVPGSFNPPDGATPNPNVDNSIVCISFTAQAGTTTSVAVDNRPPPGGRALTIGYWRNWASCAKSNGQQAPVLDRTLQAAGAPGIQIGQVNLTDTNPNPDVASSCAPAVALLSKQDFSGKQRGSDPLFNMAAQLVAVRLNLVAGAGSCGKVLTGVAQANALLAKYAFNGSGYTGKLSAADASLANSLATLLDNYNNNRACN